MQRRLSGPAGGNRGPGFYLWASAMIPNLNPLVEGLICDTTVVACWDALRLCTLRAMSVSTSPWSTDALLTRARHVSVA